jgi:hypothetical protein
VGASVVLVLLAGSVLVVDVDVLLAGNVLEVEVDVLLAHVLAAPGPSRINAATIILLNTRRDHLRLIPRRDSIISISSPVLKLTHCYQPL